MTNDHTTEQCQHDEAEGTAAAVLLVAAAEAHDQHAMAHAMCLVRQFGCPAVVVPLIAWLAAAKLREHGRPCTAGSITFLQHEDVWTFELNESALQLERDLVARTGLQLSNDQTGMWTLAGRTVLAAFNEDSDQLEALWRATEIPSTPAIALLAGVTAMLDNPGEVA